MGTICHLRYASTGKGLTAVRRTRVHRGLREERKWAWAWEEKQEERGPGSGRRRCRGVDEERTRSRDDCGMGINNNSVLKEERPWTVVKKGGARGTGYGEEEGDICSWIISPNFGLLICEFDLFMACYSCLPTNAKLPWPLQDAYIMNF